MVCLCEDYSDPVEKERVIEVRGHRLKRLQTLVYQINRVDHLLQIENLALVEQDHYDGIHQAGVLHQGQHCPCEPFRKLGPHLQFTKRGLQYCPVARNVLPGDEVLLEELGYVEAELGGELVENHGPLGKSSFPLFIGC